MSGKTNIHIPFLRHYDKILVVLALIVLLVSLAYLVTSGVAQKQRETSYILQLGQLKPKFEPLQAMDLSLYEATEKTLMNPPRMAAGDDAQPGFLLPERRATCVSSGCRKPIPVAAKQCPFCGAEQPVSKQVAVNNTDRDSDNDGIPDRVELAWGLNPNNPADAREDMDQDGFTNLDEFTSKTNPKDPNDHAPYVSKLRVKQIASKRLPLIFSAVNTMPGGKKQLTFNWTGPNPRTLWISEDQPIGESGYSAGKVTQKFEERDNPLTPGLKARVDVSTVTVKRKLDNKQWVLQINEIGKNADVEATLVLLTDNSEYPVLDSTEFKLRDETYRVLTINTESSTVAIENKADGQQKIIRKLD